jgi:hypothetical protein
VLVSSEGVGEDVLVVELPRELRAVLAGTSTGPTAPTPASPSPDQASPQSRPVPERVGSSDAPWGWWAAGALGFGALCAVLLLLGQRRRG